MFTKVRSIKVSNFVRHDDEDDVQDGLAVTPSQMEELVRRGIPVSTANLGNEFYDGLPNNDFYVAPMYQRGVDMADLWNTANDSKERITKGMKQVRANFNSQESHG